MDSQLLQRGMNARRSATAIGELVIYYSPTNRFEYRISYPAGLALVRYVFISRTEDFRIENLNDSAANMEQLKASGSNLTTSGNRIQVVHTADGLPGATFPIFTSHLQPRVLSDDRPLTKGSKCLVFFRILPFNVARSNKLRFV